MSRAEMSQDSKIIVVVAGTLVALALAIIVGAWLVQGHSDRKLSYAEATQPAQPDPTIFPPETGTTTPGLDLPKMLAGGPEAVARGKQLFGTYCTVCHGANGKGDGPAAAGLTPPPRDFTSPRGWTRGATIADLYATITEGVKGTGMGAFNMISPEDRFALAHYIQSLGSFNHEDRPPEEIEQLDQKYHLAQGIGTPNKVSVPIIMKHQEAEYAAPPAVEMPPASDTTLGAVLCRRLVADPVRAAAALSNVPDWRTQLDAFARAAMGDAPLNGFRVAVATLDRAQWKAFRDELVSRTPASPSDDDGGSGE